jgi:glutaredoxin
MTAAFQSRREPQFLYLQPSPMEFSVAFVVIGLVLVVLGSLVQIVRAFQQSVGWGVASLFIPGANIVFVICHWARAKGSLFCILIGFALIGIGGATSGKGLSVKSFFAAFTSSSNDQDVKALNASIERVRARIESLEGQLHGREGDLAKQFQMLDKRRKELNEKNAGAVQQFNADAEAYTAQNKAKKALGAELESARQELSRLLDDRARIRAANPPDPAQYATANSPATETGASTAKLNGKQIVMYTTARCPACVAAKTYLGRKGIRYEERDVERSSEALKEFRSLGGRGVPLIVVGNERMEGFYPQRLERMISE